MNLRLFFGLSGGTERGTTYDLVLRVDYVLSPIDFALQFIRVVTGDFEHLVRS
jgi:hypothetical protein